MPVKRYDGTDWVTVAGEGVQGPTGPAGASATTVVTTKGDLLSYDTTAARLGVGSNDQVLTADSSTATGLKWATPAAGGMTLINTGGTTLSGASVTLSSIPQTYKHLYAVILGLHGNQETNIAIRFNGDSSGVYTGGYTYGAGSQTNNVDDSSQIFSAYMNANTANFQTSMEINIPRYTDTSGNQLITFSGVAGQYRVGIAGGGIYRKSAAITSVMFLARSGTLSAGTVYLYGVS